MHHFLQQKIEGLLVVLGAHQVEQKDEKRIGWNRISHCVSDKNMLKQVKQQSEIAMMDKKVPELSMICEEALATTMVTTKTTVDDNSNKNTKETHNETQKGKNNGKMKAVQGCHAKVARHVDKDLRQEASEMVAFKDACNIQQSTVSIWSHKVC